MESAQGSGNLVLTRHCEQSVVINQGTPLYRIEGGSLVEVEATVVVTVLKLTKDKVRLGFRAQQIHRIDRQEVFEAKQKKSNDIPPLNHGDAFDGEDK